MTHHTSRGPNRTSLFSATGLFDMPVSLRRLVLLMKIFLVLYLLSISFAEVSVLPFTHADNSSNISHRLFNSLEELARLVDISYCVGSSGIHKPFNCLSRCSDFKGFELVT